MPVGYINESIFSQLFPSVMFKLYVSHVYTCIYICAYYFRFIIFDRIHLMHTRSSVVVSENVLSSHYYFLSFSSFSLLILKYTSNKTTCAVCIFNGLCTNLSPEWRLVVLIELFRQQVIRFCIGTILQTLRTGANAPDLIWQCCS